MSLEEQNKQDFRERVIEKIDDLKESLDDGMESIKTHESRLTKLESSMAILEKISWALFATSISIVSIAFWKLIIK